MDLELWLAIFPVNTTLGFFLITLICSAITQTPSFGPTLNVLLFWQNCFSDLSIQVSAPNSQYKFVYR
jgi:hypothetical protein